MSEKNGFGRVRYYFPFYFHENDPLDTSVDYYDWYRNYLVIETNQLVTQNGAN